jgi:hypothetical protein
MEKIANIFDPKFVLQMSAKLIEKTMKLNRLLQDSLVLGFP